MKMRFGCVVALAACVAVAETRVWQGTDGNWNTAANWNPSGVPAAGDTASFTADATISSSWTLPGNLTVSLAKGKTLTFAGAIGGAADAALTLTSDASDGSGTFKFNASSTFLGNLVIEKGLVYGMKDGAFGLASDDTAMVNLRAYNKYTKLYLQGIRNLKRIYHQCSDPSAGYAATILYSGYNTIGKYQSSSTVRTKVNANATLVITRGVVNDGIWLDYVDATGKAIISNTPAAKLTYYGEGGPGPLVFACQGNAFSSGSSIAQPYVCATNGAFASNSVLHFKAAATSCLDLNGTTQTVLRVTSAVPASGTAIGTVSSVQPALVTMTEGAADISNYMPFTGKASLEYASAGDRTLNLFGASTSEGELIVTRGTVELAAGAVWGGTVRMNGGTLKLRNQGNLATTATLKLGDGTVNVLEGVVSVKALVDRDGNALPEGRYAATASAGVTAVAGLAGSGAVQVLPEAVADGAAWTWTGAAGDGKVTTPGNWATANGEAATAENRPDFTSLGNVFHFPASAAVTLDAAVRAKRLLFDGEGDGTVTFDAAGGYGIDLYWGELVVTNTATAAKEVRFNVPVEFGGDVALSVLANDSLRFCGGFLSAGISALVKRGFGAWRVKGDAGAFIGTCANSNGVLVVEGSDPLGAACTLYNYQFNGKTDTQICLCNATLTGPVVNCPQGSIGNGAVCITASDDTRNAILGKVTNRTGHFRFRASTGAELTLAGGFTPSNFTIPNSVDFAVTRVSNTVVSVNTQLYYDNNGWDVFALAVPSNRFGAVQIGSTLRTEVNDALDAGQEVYLWRTHSRMDLWGTTQHVANVYHNVISTNAQGLVTSVQGEFSAVNSGRADLCAGTVKSDRPGAYIVFDGKTTRDLSPVFGGDVGFERAGTGTNVFYRANSSTGEVVVSGGTLRFAAPGATWTYKGVAQTYKTAEGGSWAGKRATVTAGTLAIDHAAAFPKDTVFRLRGGALAIASGVILRGEELYFQDAGAWVRQRDGVWGAADNTSVAPGHRTALITGSGLLRVGRTGTLVLFR